MGIFSGLEWLMGVRGGTFVTVVWNAALTKASVSMCSYVEEVLPWRLPC